MLLLAGLVLLPAGVRADDAPPTKKSGKPDASAKQEPAGNAATQQLPMSSRGRKKGPRGRLSLYANSSRIGATGRTAVAETELISNVTYATPDGEEDGIEFALDMRHSRFTSENRESRLSIYDGYVGARFGGGTMRARAGHMWIDDLGGLGSVAGALFEMRSGPARQVLGGRVRGGVFGGLEPQLYQMGYADDIRKFGGYATFEGSGGRKHVAGFVRVGHGSMTERSTLSVTNFLPVARRLFIYQTAEYDVKKPAGQAQRGLNYFFTNARFAPVPRVDLQATISRGRSIDIRGLTEDLLAGRAVSSAALSGLLYQSIGGRTTVEIFRGARAYVGYTRDKNNREDEATGRWLFGGYGGDVGGSGFDLTFSDNLIVRPLGSYHSRYFSIGHPLGRRVYVSADYSTSLSVLRFVRSDGFVIETRPETRRFGSSATVLLDHGI
jgi:hypothetical protein